MRPELTEARRLFLAAFAEEFGLWAARGAAVVIAAALGWQLVS